MIDAAAYRANETNAKRAIADWRLSNVNDPYIFQNQGFPVRADSFLDLAQILDTMQEGRFDYYVREIGGFTEEDAKLFVKVCLDYVDFYTCTFQRERVIVPLSTLAAHFVAYKKLLGFNPGFTRLLELGPGCGYLSFFLRHHAALADYTQIESTESFYLLQSHINSHVFGSRFAEHALSRLAQEDHGKYIPKLDWHNPFHYEDQKIIGVKTDPVCNHFPWWRIGEVAKRRYDVVASNANLNEFSREALFQYLSLIKEVLADDGAIIAQCLGGGSPTYDSIFAKMKSAGFVPVALIRGGENMDGRVFVVANGVFVGQKHPLYAKYADVTPQFPTIDRDLPFVNKMFFLNEEQAAPKSVLSPSDVLHEVLAQMEAPVRSGTDAPRSPGRPGPAWKPDMGRIGSSSSVRDANRLRRIGNPEADAISSWNREKLSAQSDAEKLRLASELASARRELGEVRSSTSWRVTAPLRSVSGLVRRFRR